MEFTKLDTVTERNSETIIHTEPTLWAYEAWIPLNCVVSRYICLNAVHCFYTWLWCNENWESHSFTEIHVGYVKKKKQHKKTLVQLMQHIQYNRLLPLFFQKTCQSEIITFFEIIQLYGSIPLQFFVCLTPCFQMHTHSWQRVTRGSSWNLPLWNGRTLQDPPISSIAIHQTLPDISNMASSDVLISLVLLWLSWYYHICHLSNGDKQWWSQFITSCNQASHQILKTLHHYLAIRSALLGNISDQGSFPASLHWYKRSGTSAGLKFWHHMPSKGAGSKTETKTATHKSVIRTTVLVS